MKCNANKNITEKLKQKKPITNRNNKFKKNVIKPMNNFCFSKRIPLKDPSKSNKDEEMKTIKKPSYLNRFSNHIFQKTEELQCKTDRGGSHLKMRNKIFFI